jgi:hypothetical protein
MARIEISASSEDSVEQLLEPSRFHGARDLPGYPIAGSEEDSALTVRGRSIILWQLSRVVKGAKVLCA